MDDPSAQAALHWGAPPAPGDYFETFTDGPTGWIANSRSPLPVENGVAICRGPWIIDANHAPPGAGYLHLLMHLHTHEIRLYAPYARAAGMYPDDFIEGKRHRFIHGGYSRDFRNLRVRVRLRGKMNLRGAKLTMLVQGHPGCEGVRGNWILTGQSLTITPEWSEQELILTTDEAAWTFLGSRHDLTDLYGYVPIGDVLADVNVSIIFVLFPLTIEPLAPVADPHKAWAGQDYEARPDLLPEGEVQFDYVWFAW